MLSWRSLITSRDHGYMVKGTELAVALHGPNSRYAIYEVRCYDMNKNSDVQYRVRDADTINDQQVKDGERPDVIFTGKTLDETINFITNKSDWK